MKDKRSTPVQGQRVADHKVCECSKGYTCPKCLKHTSHVLPKTEATKKPQGMTIKAAYEYIKANGLNGRVFFGDPQKVLACKTIMGAYAKTLGKPLGRLKRHSFSIYIAYRWAYNKFDR